MRSPPSCEARVASPPEAPGSPEADDAQGSPREPGVSATEEVCGPRPVLRLPRRTGTLFAPRASEGRGSAAPLRLSPRPGPYRLEVLAPRGLTRTPAPAPVDAPGLDLIRKREGTPGPGVLNVVSGRH